MKPTAPAALVWALAVGAAAQEPPPAPSPSPPAALQLTLAQAVESAVAASPSLAHAQSLQRAAEAETRMARAGRLPQLELQAGYTRLSDVPELTIPFPGGGLRTIFPNIPDNYRTRAALAMPLYTGGRLSGLLEAAESERRGFERDVATARSALALEATVSYWTLVTARQRERVMAEAVQAYEAHLSDALNRERFGLAARNEVLAVQVERDRALLARLRAANAAAVAELDLARLIGAADGARLEPVEPLSPSELPAEEPPALPLLTARALEARPERAALLFRIGAAEARVKAERGARLPQAALSAGLDYANPNRRILPPEARFQESWEVAVNLTWSVFDGGRGAGAVARAQARVEAARSQLEELERGVALQVARQALELQAARAAVRVAQTGLEAARESARVARERYRAGVLGSAELLDAEVALQRADLEHTEALAQVRLAAAALARALGE